MPRVGSRGPRGYKKQAAAKAAANRGRPWVPAVADKAAQAAIRNKVPKRKRPVLAATQEMQRDGIVRAGGARPGAGRPAGMPWQEIERHARAGAALDDILKGLPSLKVEALEDPANVERLRAVVEAGNAAYRLSLQRSMHRKAKSGSVHAQALLARNHMHFDQQTGMGNGEAPDVTGIANKLLELIERATRKLKADADELAAEKKKSTGKKVSTT